MRAFLIYSFFAVLAMSVQATFFKETKPDFVLLLVCFYSFRYGHVKGMSYGAVAGLFADMASGSILGPNAMSKMLIGYLVPTVKQRVFQWSIVFNSVMVVFLSLLDIVVVSVCLQSFADIDFGNRSVRISLAQATYTTICSLLLYPVLQRGKNDAVYG